MNVESEVSFPEEEPLEGQKEFQSSDQRPAIVGKGDDVILSRGRGGMLHQNLEVRVATDDRVQDDYVRRGEGVHGSVSDFERNPLHEPFFSRETLCHPNHLFG